MKAQLFSYVILIAANTAWLGCNNQPEPKEPFNPTQMQESMIKENREFVQEENEKIDKYIKRHKLKMTRTNTGLRYEIYEKGNGEQAITGKWAKVIYTVKLLDGTELYNTKEKGAESFLIGQDNVESGIHEGIQLMKVGDKARFILPAHLAHGLTGDQDKIPPRSAIIYDIELVSLK